jgi:hypothetical protein
LSHPRRRSSGHFSSMHTSTTGADGARAPWAATKLSRLAVSLSGHKRSSPMADRRPLEKLKRVWRRSGQCLFLAAVFIFPNAGAFPAAATTMLVRWKVGQR